MENHRRYGGRKVLVAGRQEQGVVVDEGRNIGDVYCVAVYFASTGEVAFFEKSRVETVTE